MQIGNPRKTAAFTLIELMVVVLIVGVLAAVAVPVFLRYLRASKTVEAVEGLNTIQVGASQYYNTNHYSAKGDLLYPRFPANVDNTPKKFKDCCEEPTQANPKCAPDLSPTTGWNQPTWRALHFQLSDPHYYVWAFTQNNGSASNAAYTAIAVGNLDCDDERSTFKIIGKADAEWGLRVSGPIITDRLE